MGQEAKKPVNEMSFEERQAYLREKYLPHLKSASLTFMIFDSGFDYDLKDKSSHQKILNFYREQADYTEYELPKKTDYAIEDWSMVRQSDGEELGLGKGEI